MVNCRKLLVDKGYRIRLLPPVAHFVLLDRPLAGWALLEASVTILCVDTLPADIRQRIVRDFGESSADQIYGELLRRVPRLGNGTRSRHLRCIVFLSHGDEEQLSEWIDLCLLDPRDLIVQTEYADGKRVRPSHAE